MINIEKKWMQFHNKHLVKRKLHFVAWFDKKFPGKYCWADCVSWAFDWRCFNPFKIGRAEGCKIESEQYPHCCYCGKWSNGKLWQGLSKEERNAIRGMEEIVHSEDEDLPF